ncbi:isochorismatase family protein [Pseudoalteromonas arctica]|uniref:Isochorismatase family protein n=1 Tax=Pseudoalteromonas arctica TaxID=394751 RepID=A0A7Y0HB86_9GAMM|nr:isochorismatase family protein [Pseudoalteromonas arctica]NMM39607.1 isochorismatase family protein [Pseudoalteromonas arctica]
MTIPAIQDYAFPTANEYPAAKVDWAIEPKKAALLIHDMQDYFINFYHPASPMMSRVIKQISALKAWAKEQRIPVYYTAQPAEQSDESRGLLTDMWGPGLTAKPELANIVASLTPEQSDRLLTKWRYSAFFLSDLAEQMMQEQRDQLIICGIYAHIGVLQTAAEAFMKSIKPFVMADAIADFSRDDHLYALRYVQRNLGMVSTVTESIAIDSLISS